MSFKMKFKHNWNFLSYVSWKNAFFLTSYIFGNLFYILYYSFTLFFFCLNVLNLSSFICIRGCNSSNSCCNGWGLEEFLQINSDKKKRICIFIFHKSFLLSHCKQQVVVSPHFSLPLEIIFGSCGKIKRN